MVMVIAEMAADDESDCGGVDVNYALALVDFVRYRQAFPPDATVDFYLFDASWSSLCQEPRAGPLLWKMKTRLAILSGSSPRAIIYSTVGYFGPITTIALLI